MNFIGEEPRTNVFFISPRFFLFLPAEIPWNYGSKLVYRIYTYVIRVVMKSLVFYCPIWLVSQVGIVHLHTVANKRKSKFYTVNVFTVITNRERGSSMSDTFSSG